jgi:hypothetical protein
MHIYVYVASSVQHTCTVHMGSGFNTFQNQLFFFCFRAFSSQILDILYANFKLTDSIYL